MSMVITFSNGEWIEKTSHNTDLTATQGMKARSTDCGETWTVVQYSIGGPGPEPGNINFAHPDLALKVSRGTPSYYVSYDRARNFAGPYGFGDLLDQSPLAGKAFTSRTDYIVNSANELFFFMSSISSVNDLDFTYMAKTSNAGASFSCVSQIDPGDPDRNVMPSTVRISDNALVTCLAAAAVARTGSNATDRTTTGAAGTRWAARLTIPGNSTATHLLSSGNRMEPWCVSTACVVTRVRLPCPPRRAPTTARPGARSIDFDRTIVERTPLARSISGTHVRSSVQTARS